MRSNGPELRRLSTTFGRAATDGAQSDERRRRHLDGLLAIIVLALIVLLAWPTHSASDSPVDDLAGMVDPRVSQAVANRRPGQEIQMRLILERVSTRNTANEYGVIDELTGKRVGTISFERMPRGNRNYPPRTIRLFDSKYIGSFNTHTECVAFVKGVETVLNYMLGAKEFETVTARLT